MKTIFVDYNTVTNHSLIIIIITVFFLLCPLLLMLGAGAQSEVFFSC